MLKRLQSPVDQVMIPQRSLESFGSAISTPRVLLESDLVEHLSHVLGYVNGLAKVLLACGDLASSIVPAAFISLSEARLR